MGHQRPRLPRRSGRVARPAGYDATTRALAGYVKLRGDLLAARRVELGLSQDALAQRLRTSQHDITRIETGVAYVSEAYARGIAAQLGVTGFETLLAARVRLETVSAA